MSRSADQPCKRFCMHEDKNVSSTAKTIKNRADAYLNNQIGLYDILSQPDFVRISGLLLFHTMFALRRSVWRCAITSLKAVY